MGLVGRMAALARRVFPKNFLRNTNRKLESTKIALAAEEYVGISLLIALLVGIVAGLIGTFLWAPLPALLIALVAVFIAFPVLTLGVPYYLATRRAAELEGDLPDALRQMASILRAGVSVDAAMEDIVKSKYGALSQEFDRVVTEVRRGRALGSSLLAFSRRSSSSLCKRAIYLIVEGIERGAALAGLLDAISADTRGVRAIQRERRAATTQQVLFLLVVALFAVPFVVGLTMAISAGMGTAVTSLPAGMTTIAMAYIVIQAFICSLAVGIIRYGKMLNGLTFTLPFMVAAAAVFYAARFVIGFVV